MTPVIPPSPGCALAEVISTPVEPRDRGRCPYPGRETVYRRAGRGARILLLAAGDDDGRFGEALVHLLAPDFQVLAPRVPAGLALAAPVVVSAWLRDLMDGLGLERPDVVADESLGLAVLAFALLDPERIDRLVVVCRDSDGGGGGLQAIRDRFALAGHNILLLVLDASPGAPELTLDTRGAFQAFLRRGPRDD